MSEPHIYFGYYDSELRHGVQNFGIESINAFHIGFGYFSTWEHPKS